MSRFGRLERERGANQKGPNRMGNCNSQRLGESLSDKCGSTAATKRRRRRLRRSKGANSSGGGSGSSDDDSSSSDLMQPQTDPTNNTNNNNNNNANPTKPAGSSDQVKVIDLGTDLNGSEGDEETGAQKEAAEREKQSSQEENGQQSDAKAQAARRLSSGPTTESHAADEGRQPPASRGSEAHEEREQRDRMLEKLKGEFTRALTR